MKNFTHEDQRRIWDAEHTTPTVLPQMDRKDPSAGVRSFYDFLKQVPGEKIGIEMGCGKGRNVIWLAQQESIRTMCGLDFSVHAIEEAKKRVEAAAVGNASFYVQDVTERWPFQDDSVDFVIDCFASTDIESPERRQKAVDESFRVLKKSGYLFAYALSTDDGFHREMIEHFPAQEKHAFHHPSTGKFEKAFDEGELADLHRAFGLIESRRIEKKEVFFGKEYDFKHFWNVYQKV